MAHLCKRGLHDLSAPNAMLPRKNASAICRLCNRDKQRKFAAERLDYCRDRKARRLNGQPEITIGEFNAQRQLKMCSARAADHDGTRRGDVPGLSERALCANDGTGTQAS